MSNTKSTGGQSSKGFLHWLKNTWQKFWNWITSCFKPKNKETESQSASEEQEKAVNNSNDGDKSKSPESSSLEWDFSYDRDSPKKDETQGYSSQLEQKLDNNYTKGEKGNRKRKNDSETNDIPCKISKKEDWIKKKAHRKQVQERKEKTNKGNSEATERRGSKQGQNIGYFTVVHDDSAPNSNLSSSSSSLPSSSGQKY